MLDKPGLLNNDLIADALEGLKACPKHLSPKWFYDTAGSALFEEITRLPEYYPTRTETAILRANTAKMAALADENTVLVELGSGASVKTRILLGAMARLGGYAPLDISAEFLTHTAAEIAADYPQLSVTPVIADFMEPLRLPVEIDAARKLIFFPGSTIGNLEREAAEALLCRLRKLRNADTLILGIDLVKDMDRLVAAYDDGAGVTSRFNKNLLARLNREAGADFDVNAFRHEARWNGNAERIEMHLVSTLEQRVTIGGQLIEFALGESLHTENSHKFTMARMRDLAKASGWTVADIWCDTENLFAVAILNAGGQ